MNAEADRFTFLVAGPEVDHIDLESPCYALPAFPPPHDFPMMVDRHGEPVCLYGDHKWRIGAYPFNFGTEPGDLGCGGLSVTQPNGELLKRCTAWFMYGDRRSISVNTLASYHQKLKHIFAFCSSLERPIVASELSRFFDTLEGALAQAIRPGQAKGTMGLLYELWLVRATLGFHLLDPKQITRLLQLIPEHKGRQTQFIPPRIWAYQAGRLQGNRSKHDVVGRARAPA